MTEPVDIVVVGSIGIDTVETPFERREHILGGSASYACAAASFFGRVGIVGVVGGDFPSAYEELYRHFRIDLAGLQKQETGETFRWSGVYRDNMNERDTLSTELNVLEDFSPELPDAYRHAPFLFLANISPTLQLHVLEQVQGTRFVAMDTMDLWINIQREALLEVIGRVDLLTLNESEARHLSGIYSLREAAQYLLALGPEYVLIKKGEHGSMLFTKDTISLLPAYPLNQVKDPTGAGDAFAGGLMGALCAAEEISPAALRSAILIGSIVASFAVEEFSLDRLRSLDRKQMDQRVQLFKRMLQEY
jgi:cytidine kinase